MEIQEIITQLENYVTQVKEQIDADAGRWASLKAREDFNEDMKKVQLAKCQAKHEGSDSATKTLALQDPEYQAFIEKKCKDTAEYLVADYKKSQMEKQIEVLRSLLSFNRLRIQQDV